MEKFVKGDIVVIPFPFSNLTGLKKRPALIVANPLGDDVLLAQITSKINLNKYSIRLKSNDFIIGKLPLESFVKINRLFSADLNLIKYKVGKISKNKEIEIKNKIISYLCA